MLRKPSPSKVSLLVVHTQTAATNDSTSDGNLFPLNADGTLKTVDRPTFNESYAEMKKLLATGKVRAIGVSSFSIKT